MSTLKLNKNRSHPDASARERFNSKVDALSASMSTHSRVHDNLMERENRCHGGKELEKVKEKEKREVECEDGPYFEERMQQSQSFLSTGKKFKDMLKRMQNYIDIHRSGKVFENHDPELYRWQQGWLQKLSKVKDKLSEDDIKVREQLLVLGFPFHCNVLSKSEQRAITNEKKWGKMFTRLFDYCRKNKTLKVSEKDDLDLHRWVTSQRSTLSDSASLKSFAHIERRRRLQRIGFQWHCGTKCARVENGPILDSSSRTKRAPVASRSSWKERFAELERLPNPNMVSRRDMPELYRWMQRQRCSYNELQRGEQNSMSDERIRLLEGIGFLWSAKDSKRRSVHLTTKVKAEPNISSFFRCRLSQQDAPMLDLTESDNDDDKNHDDLLRFEPFKKRRKIHQEMPLPEETTQSSVSSFERHDPLAQEQSEHMSSVQARPSNPGSFLANDSFEQGPPADQHTLGESIPSHFYSSPTNDTFSREQTECNIDEIFFDIIANLARLSVAEVDALKAYGIENGEDLALLREDAICKILCSTSSSMKVTRLYQLGRFVAKNGELTLATTMRDVVLFLG